MRSSRKDISIIPILPKYLLEFGDYIAKVFHPRYVLLDDKFRSWQYGGNFHVAVVGGKIVGHVGFRDIPYKIYDRVSPIRVLMNLFVLPEFRIAGLGALLLQAVLDQKIPVLVSGYSKGTDQVLQHLRKKWQNKGNLRRFIWINGLKTHPLLAGYPSFGATRPSSRQKGFEIGFCKSFDKRFDTLWEKLRDKFPVTAKRSSDYLRWRFETHPRTRYQTLVAKAKNQLLGYLTFHIEEDQGFRIARMVDLFAEENAAAALLDSGLDHLQKKDCNAADFFASGNYFDSALEASGFSDVAGTAWENFPSLFNPISAKKNYINIGCDFEAEISDCYFVKAEGDQDRPNPH